MNKIVINPWTKLWWIQENNCDKSMQWIVKVQGPCFAAIQACVRCLHAFLIICGGRAITRQGKYSQSWDNKHRKYFSEETSHCELFLNMLRVKSISDVLCLELCVAGAVDHAGGGVVTNEGHLMWSWMTAGVARLDKNPPSKPPVSPEGDVARGVNPPSLPQKEEAMDSPIGVMVPAGLEMDPGVLLQYQHPLIVCF